MQEAPAKQVTCLFLNSNKLHACFLIHLLLVDAFEFLLDSTGEKKQLSSSHLIFIWDNVISESPSINNYTYDAKNLLCMHSQR